MLGTDVGFSLDELIGLEQYLSRDSDIAFVSGSQQAGLGNSASDYDLYIVYQEGMERLTHGPRQFLLLDPPRRVDLERLGFDEIVESAERGNAAAGNPTPASVRHLPFDDFDLYYRTLMGRPMANPAGFDALMSHLDKQRCEQVYSAWNLWQAGLELARARAQLAQERPEAAFAAARLALRQTVNAQVASEGFGWPNPKWAFVKLEHLHGRDSSTFQAAWRLNGLGGRDLPQHLESVEAYCLGRGAPRLRPRPRASLAPAWNGEVLQVSIANTPYLVHRRQKVFRLDDAALFLCRRIDGRATVEAIGEDFAARFDLDPHVATYRADELVRRLAGLGLLRLRDEFELEGGF
jgi:hypothetical protein